MSDKMRWYMIAFWIFLTLSVLHFALAAPVVVGEIREVDLRDEIATWEKRMDPNDDAPGNNIDAEGIKERAWGQWPGPTGIGNRTPLTLIPRGGVLRWRQQRQRQRRRRCYAELAEVGKERETCPAIRASRDLRPHDIS
ncbi:hypothetical protein BGY98DRAFT_1116703 [Russula aff. rugulosa BPL654]|nr:hypothetical protein BGY98DRAFT_1116703 [Russula aff. rugulosa BPL654]